MELGLVIAYTVVYFVGYYGAHLLNLLVRRVLVSNLRLAGLGALAVSAAAAVYVIQTHAPKNATPYMVGQLQGRLAIGPAVIVATVVAVRWWLEVRRAGKLGAAARS